MDDFKRKFNEFMSRRNGPDTLARDTLILAIVLLVTTMFMDSGLAAAFQLMGLASMGYSYWRLFSSKISERRRENSAYIAKRNQLLAKVKAPFQKAVKQGQKTAEQAKDKEHRYFDCPKCGQNVRVPKGAGKIRVTCPKCGEKFERKA